jgi:hypothetical protein
MTIFRRAPAERAEEVIPGDGVYRTPLLPGFELLLAPILATAAHWTKRKS